MIKSVRSLYEYDLKFNRFKSEYNENLRLEDKLYFISQAQDTIFRNKVDRSTERNSKYRNELRYLEVKEYELEKLKSFKSYSIYKIPDNFYKFLRQRSIQNRENCSRKEVELLFFETDDLNAALKNPFWKPSFQWEHGICDEGSEGLYVWHEEGVEVEKVIVDYYRRPIEVHAPSLHPNKKYESWNGEIITKDTFIELENNLNDIINLAILNTKASLGDVKDYELQLSNILNTEKIN